MPFARVSKSALGSRIKPDEIKMGWHKTNQKGSSKAIYISVAHPIIEGIGWKMVDEKASDTSITSRYYTNVAIMEGTGEDAGFIMLVEHWEKDGYVLGNNKGSSKNTAFSMGITNTRFAHYVINNFDEEIPPSLVNYTVDEKDQTILIECPDWFRYDPTSVPEPAKPEPEPVKEVVETRRPLPRIVVEANHDDDDRPKLNRTDRRRLASKVARALTR